MVVMIAPGGSCQAVLADRPGGLSAWGTWTLRKRKARIATCPYPVTRRRNESGEGEIEKMMFFWAVNLMVVVET